MTGERAKPVERGRHFLQLPGPSPVPDRVLRAMHRSGNDFADPRFVAMTRRCLADLGQIFGTAGPVFVFSANGHGAWEAVLANLLDPGDAVLVPGTGWVAIDPTNRTFVDQRFVTTAWGRDYADVPPLKGIVIGPPGASSTLQVAVGVVPVPAGS